MALNTELVGKTYTNPEYTYTHRDAIIYALSIGADETDLEFLYEKHGPLVYPSYATVASGLGGSVILDDIGINPITIIHGGQRVTVHGPIPANATVQTEATIAGIYDKGKNALVELDFKSSVDGELLFENLVTMIIRGEGGFGGERGPAREVPVAPDRAADKEIKIQTEKRQALMYRLSGDWNPLHADPDIAKMVGFEAPILHGLCTYGATTRAIVKELCGNDPAKLKSMSVRFSSPVIPGDLLTVETRTEDKIVFVEVKNQAGATVLTNGVFELA